MDAAVDGIRRVGSNDGNIGSLPGFARHRATNCVHVADRVCALCRAHVHGPALASPLISVHLVFSFFRFLLIPKIFVLSN